MRYFMETDPCWLGLDKLDALGAMTFSLLGASQQALTDEPIRATLAQEIATLVHGHDGALVTDTLSGADVILATKTTLAELPADVAAPCAGIVTFPPPKLYWASVRLPNESVEIGLSKSASDDAWLPAV